MRFAVARQSGLDEGLVDEIDDGWDAGGLSARQKAALGFTDAYLSTDGPLDGSARAAFDEHFAGDEQTELGVGLALFHGFSKVLIALGCEPEAMDTTILKTPGS